VTLAFLGEVDDPEPLHEPLRRAAERTPPLELRLRGSGTFGGRGGHVWVGLDGDLAGLAALAGRVEDACRGAGVELPRRPYRPHLTVGRRGHPDPVLLGTYAGPTWPVTEVELVRSHLGRTVEHVVLRSWPVGG
jgi:2'-5' RNA ligase